MVRSRGTPPALHLTYVDYDEEQEMEPRPEPRREATPTLRTRSSIVRRQRERVVGFEDAPNKEGSRRGRNAEGIRPSEIEAKEGSFVDSIGSVTLFVRWIEEYPLPDGLKMTSYIGSYDGKGDLDNFLHLFEGAILMQKWLMPIACHMFTYTFKDSARIWWNSQKIGSILNYEDLKAKFRYTNDTLQILGLHEEQCISGFVHGLRTRCLVEHLSTDLPSTYKGRRGPFRTIIEDKKEGIGSPHTEDQTMNCPHMFRSRRLQDMSKYYHFHEDHGHETNDYRQLRNQIEEAVNSGQLFHLVKGIKKERVKDSENQRTEGKKDKSTTPAKPPILMIRQDESYMKNKSESLNFEGKEITFPSEDSNSSAPIVIKAKIFEREVNRVHMDGGSSCEDINAEDGNHSFYHSRGHQIPHRQMDWHCILDTRIRQGKRRSEEGQRDSPTIEKGVFICTTTEEKTHVDITWIPRTIMVKGKPFNTEHKLNEYTHVKPIKQKRRGLGPGRNTAACKEVGELMKAGILRKVKHQTWVANRVMVKKSDGGWRMCVDFTDINKACPKDCYPLPEIDWKVESLSGFWLKCFLDAYKGYHQIQMVEGDEDKTTFFAGEGVFCYQKMPFGLKNVGATYQRLVDKVFHDQIGRNLEVYVDDMLNPKKCSFGIEEGLFLGHLITKKGIPANPWKVKSITDVGQLKTLRDIQSLNGKIAALSHFLSKGAERSFPFFKVLKSYTNKKNIQWTQEAEAALQEMKRFVEILSTLTVPVQGEILMIYLTASTKSISFTLFAKREEEQQGCYEGQVAKWAIEFGEHDIVFQERGNKMPKDFLIEVPFEDNKKETREKADTKPAKTSCEWKLFTNGAVISDGSGPGLMLIDPEGKEYTYALHFGFETTNNEAEYEALLVGLRLSKEMEITSLAIFIDSQLLVNQIKGTYAVKQPTIREYLQKTKEALKGFDSYTIEHIRRNQNKKADALSKLASMTFEHLTKEVLVEVC
ncbi:reverse transcriptase domain-containing protein [Tanacetum coccineum]